MAAIEKMNAYSTSVTCRHAALVEHFGQTWDRGPCGACDVCLDQLEVVDDALVIGQKVLSCVLRVQERFGADYVSLVLVGSRDERILTAKHNELSTWGLLAEFRRQDVRQWIEQLVNQGYLLKDGEFHTLRVSDEGRRLLRGERSPTLLRPAKKSAARSSAIAADSWDGVDRELFDLLRQLRRNVAAERGVPAYIVFSDATLRDMARQRPSTKARLLEVRGIGQQKLADFGERFLDCITSYCSNHGVDTDEDPERVATPPPVSTPSANAVLSFPLFEMGLSVAQVAERLGRALSTVHGYLEAYIRQRRVTDASRWIEKEELEQIASAVESVGSERLKPIYEFLQGRVPYERIRTAVACLSNRSNAPRSAGDVIAKRD